MSDQDPSVELWRIATGQATGTNARDTQSTSAKLRAVEAELGSALSALTRSNAEIERLRALLKDAYGANLRLINERPNEPHPGATP